MTKMAITDASEQLKSPLNEYSVNLAGSGELMSTRNDVMPNNHYVVYETSLTDAGRRAVMMECEARIRLITADIARSDVQNPGFRIENGEIDGRHAALTRERARYAAMQWGLGE